MAFRVVFSPNAQADLIDIYDYIAPLDGPERALAYVERIEATCVGLALFPKRGRERNDIRPGLRVTGFERRATIAYHIEAERVGVDRLLYAGRRLEGAFDEG